ncbi:hypothetical protein V7138_15085 [Bacillus sp. JJ1533]|uniref:hypothetical protein n=1 Tax=Bacillus sp. JJ1533 TaxID=3122959 RepID=UPI002FFE6775
MDKVVDLATFEATKNSQKNEFYAFIEEVVELNKDLIAENIIKLKHDFDPYFIVDTYACQCLAHGLSNKDSEWFLSAIGNGNLFNAKSLLVDGLLNEPLIKQVL